MMTRRRLTRAALVTEAASLKSEAGENPEYDRALTELIYWTVGGDSIEAVAAEITALQQSAIRRLRSKEKKRKEERR